MFREESGDLDALGAHFNELDIAPPPLRHQRSQDHLTDVPMYRSLLDASMRADMSSHAPYEEYEEEPVYRSVFPHSGGHAGYSDDYHDTCEHRFLPEWGFLHADDPRHSKLCGDSPSCNQSGCGALLSGPSAFAFDFDFSPDIFDLVLNFLPCAPGALAGACQHAPLRARGRTPAELRFPHAHHAYLDTPLPGLPTAPGTRWSHARFPRRLSSPKQTCSAQWPPTARGGGARSTITCGAAGTCRPRTMPS